MRRLIYTLSVFLLCAAFCACHNNRAANSKQPESIGVAHMLDDGTIVLDLRTSDTGLIGESSLTYPKASKDYNIVLKHLGGMKPGEVKRVAPWPNSPSRR